MTPKPPTAPDGPQVDRRTLPRERPWLSKPRPKRRTGATVGALPAVRLSDLPRVMTRVPRLTADRLTALAEVQNRPVGTVVAAAIAAYLDAQDGETAEAMNRIGRRVQARRLAGKVRP